MYLAESPDSSSIVTGAGDETLRFWKIFPPKHSNKGCNTVGTPNNKSMGIEDLRWII